MVPITHQSWHKVPKVLKEELWNRAGIVFEVDSDSKKKIISAIGEKWRTFKNNLTTKYITPFIDQPELLTHPPKGYSFIEQEHWDVFVRSRVSQNFQDLSKLQKERRAKYIYNHRLSKKGYVGLEEELEQTGISVAELDRSVLWKKARQDKRGDFLNEAIKEKADQIDELTKQVEQGRVVIEGSKDILTTVLGTKEHSGRVRGIGKFVSPRTFFNLPRRGSTQYINELEEKQRMLEVKLEEEMEIRQQQADELLETKQMVLQLQAQFMAIMGQSSRLAESPCLAPLLAETSSDIGKTASRDKIQMKDDIPSTVLNSRLEESREKSKTKGDMPSTVPNSRLAESRDMRKTKSDMPSTVSNSRLGESRDKSKTKCDMPSTFPNSKLGESRNKSKTKDDVPSIVRNSRLGEGKPCRLTFGSQTTIVARAVVFERLGPKERIHNIMLGDSNVRVTIEHAVAPDVLLPLPSGDMTRVRDAIGSHVAWPKKFVLTDTEVVAHENNQEKCTKCGSLGHNMQTCKEVPAPVSTCNQPRSGSHPLSHVNDLIKVASAVNLKETEVAQAAQKGDGLAEVPSPSKSGSSVATRSKRLKPPKLCVPSMPSLPVKQERTIHGKGPRAKMFRPPGSPGFLGTTASPSQ